MMKHIPIFFIRAYQYAIRPFLGPCCRFYPTCSDYAIDAFSKKSLLKAIWLIAYRLMRCNPWHPGGYDPLP